MKVGRFFIAATGAALAMGASAQSVPDRVNALPAGQQAELFAKLIGNSGERCNKVTRVFYQGAAKDGAGFWSVACRPGTDWQVMVANNSSGSSRILECKVIAALKAGQCFTPFK